MTSRMVNPNHDFLTSLIPQIDCHAKQCKKNRRHLAPPPTSHELSSLLSLFNFVHPPFTIELNIDLILVINKSNQLVLEVLLTC
jgi:hypothetical protein